MGLDVGIFRLINRDSVNPLFDWLLPRVTDAHFNTPFLVLVGLALLVADRRQGWRAFLVALVAVGLAELIGSHWLKHAIARPRPPLTLADVRLFAPLGHSFSFPSGHAIDTFAATAAAGLAQPRWRWPLLAYAVTIGYSRVYVGVHYPSDVVGGALLGLLLAYGVWCFAEERRWVQSR